MNSFWTTVTADASALEQDVLNAAKVGINYIDNVLVTEIVPELEAALKTALSTFGSTLLASFLTSLAGGQTVTPPVNPAPPAAV